MSETSKKLSSTAKALVKKQQAIVQGAELLAASVSDWQVIRDYLTNRVQGLQLTRMQEEKMKRYQFMYNQLASGKYMEREVVNMAMKHFDIEQWQALDDMHHSKELYCTVFPINKLFELRVQLDLNRTMLQKCSDANDTKGYAALEKNRAKLIELIPEIEENAADNFKPHTWIIRFDPTLIGAKPVDMKAILDYIKQRHKGTNTNDIQEAEVIDE